MVQMLLIFHGHATTLEAAGYHDFYEPQGLFTKTKIDLTSDNKIWIVLLQFRFVLKKYSIGN
jgi:hypothetical protein